jgi:hypothetical protein
VRLPAKHVRAQGPKMRLVDRSWVRARVTRKIVSVRVALGFSGAHISKRLPGGDRLLSTLPELWS